MTTSHGHDRPRRNVHVATEACLGLAYLCNGQFAPRKGFLGPFSGRAVEAGSTCLRTEPLGFPALSWGERRIAPEADHYKLLEELRVRVRAVYGPVIKASDKVSIRTNEILRRDQSDAPHLPEKWETS